MINFKSINVVLKGKIIKSSLKIEEGRIDSIGKSSNEEGYSFDEYYLVPGFIDQHIHGAAGFDFMDASNEALEGISKALLMEGTTSFLGTTMTQSDENITKALDNLIIKETSGANLVGVHLEGPFINLKLKGAQPGEYVIPADVEKFKKWNKNNNIKIISMAVENDSNYELTKYAVKNNIVVSQAHTDATHKESNGAVELGARGFTHAYNAMSKLHHRDIGVVGTMLINNNAYAELICDKIHVSEEAVKLLYKNKGKDNIILITDSMRAKYLPEGKSELGGQDVFVKGDTATLVDGTLAGSILKMNVGVKNMMEINGIPLYEAVQMASTNPAVNLGLTNKGLIKEGFDADLTVLDKDLNVVMTIVNGKILYKK